MKLPAELLRPLVEPPYVPQAGDIEIAKLQKVNVIGQVIGDTAPIIISGICDETFNLTAAGMRTINVFKSMKDGNRRKIFRFVSNCAKNVGEIAVHLGLDQPSASYHLGIMLSEGLLKKNRDGKHSLYQVSEECRSAVRSLCHSLDQLKGAEGKEEKQSEESEEQATLTVSLLCDGMRLQILHILQSQDETAVNKMCEILHISQPGVSHHLALMRKAGLIQSRIDGRYRFYSIPKTGKVMLINVKRFLRTMIGLTPS